MNSFSMVRVRVGVVASCVANQSRGALARQIFRVTNLSPKKCGFRPIEFPSAISPASPTAARPNSFSPNAPAWTHALRSAGCRARAAHRPLRSMPCSPISSLASSERAEAAFPFLAKAQSIHGPARAPTPSAVEGVKRCAGRLAAGRTAVAAAQSVRGQPHPSDTCFVFDGRVLIAT